MSRKTDLENHIRESYQIIRECEENVRLTENPKERLRNQRTIEEQRELIQKYLDEYQPLCRALDQSPPKDIAQIIIIIINGPEPQAPEPAVSEPAKTSQRGIASDLLRSIRQALMRCDEFQSPRQLSAVMDVEPLRPWQAGLPGADSLSARVDVTISYLANKHRASGENALVLLLQVLADRYAVQDERHQVLLDLADELRGTNREKSPDHQQPESSDLPLLSDAASNTLTWLHLSDLHFRESHSYDESVVLQALLHDVADRIHQDGLCPDFIAITGDLAFSGKPAEYELTRSFLDGLLKTTNLPRERLFIVPGNHDVDRGLVTTGAKAITGALLDRDSTNSVLSDATDLGIIMRRFKGYASFVNDYFGAQVAFDKQYFYVRSLVWSDFQVMLLGLNSAWVCATDNDKSPGILLGERQVRAALEQTRQADIKIALLHHPFDWLREFDQPDSAAMLTDGCDFILHGHLHRTAATQLSGPDTSAMIIGGGACYETRKYPNTYNLVRLNLGTRTGTIYLRRYSDERGGFWAKDTMAYRNAPDGEYTFGLRRQSH